MATKQRVPLKSKVMEENDRVASALRSQYRERGIFCMNLVSSPGAGKTTLLEKTLETLPESDRVAVLTGDVQTENDAVRLARYGYPVQQIATGGSCHLDSHRIERSLAAWQLDDIGLLIIENVGNLICPSSYDLGEAARVVLLSVTEGEDKPLKYPATFAKADVVVLTKIDLVPHLTFDLDQVRENIRLIGPQAMLLEVSATSGEGMDRWLEWIEERRGATSASLPDSVSG